MQNAYAATGWALEKSRYWNINEEAVDRTAWGTGAGRARGLTVKRIT